MFSRDLSNEIVDIGIIGAGPGGLAAAHALSKQGFAVAIFEKAKQLRPIGAALGLQAGGYAALEQISEELAKRVRSLSTNPTHQSLIRPNGEVLFADESPLKDSPFTWTAWFTLQTCLRESLPPSVEIFLDHKLLSFSNLDESQIELKFEGRDSRFVRVLIGADGYNSAVRAITVNDGAPLYTGTMTWRGILKLDELRNQLPAAASAFPFEARHGFQMIVGGRKNLWIMDSGPGLLAWTATAERADPDKSADPLRSVLDVCAAFPEHAISLIAATEPEAIVETGVFDRVPVDRWCEVPCQAARTLAGLSRQMRLRIGDDPGILHVIVGAVMHHIVVIIIISWIMMMVILHDHQRFIIVVVLHCDHFYPVSS